MPWKPIQDMLPQPLISKTLKNKTWVGLRSIYKLILISPFHNSIEKQSQWLHPHRNLTYGVRGQIKQFCSGELFKFTSKSAECWTSYSKCVNVTCHWTTSYPQDDIHTFLQILQALAWVLFKSYPVLQPGYGPELFDMESMLKGSTFQNISSTI